MSVKKKQEVIGPSEGSDLTPITDNIFDVEADVILHQVNCIGVMNAGMAREIRWNYPAAYHAYAKKCLESKASNLLGDVLFHNISKNKSIGHVFGQLDYGRRNKCYTNYAAVETAMEKVNAACKGLTVVVPHRMGCGLGGGDWKIYKKIIEDKLTDCKVIVCRKEGTT